MWLEDKDKTISPCPQLKLHKLYAFICHKRHTQTLDGGGGGAWGCFLSARMGAISLKACEMFSSSIKKCVGFDQVHR